MKKLKSTISILLAVVMVCGFVLPYHAAAVGADTKVDLNISKVQDGVYKLSYIATSTKNVDEAGLILSFDNTKIAPADAKNFTEITANDGDSQSTPASEIKFAMVDAFGKKTPYTSAITIYLKGTRSAISCGLASANNAGVTPSTTCMFELYFRLKTGVAEADLDNSSFKIETDTSEGSFLKRAVRPYGVILKTADGTVNGNASLEHDMPVTLTYPNSTADTLTGVTIAAEPAKTIAVPTFGKTATLNLSATAQGTDGAYNGAAITWSILETTGVSIENNGKLTVSPSASEGTVAVTATATAGGDTKTATADVTITKVAAVATTVEVSGADSITVPTGTDVTEKYTATVKDQYGEDISPQPSVTWSVSPADQGVTVSSGTVTITKDATVQDYTVTAASGEKSASVKISVINKDVVTVSGVSVTDKTYDGNAVVYTGTPTATKDSTAVSISDYTYTWYKGETVLSSAPKDAGTYNLVVAVADSNVDYSGKQEITFTISKAEITEISGITAADKIYDGNQTAVLGLESAILTGKVGSDSVSIQSAAGVFANKNVGTGIGVTVSNVVLGGAAAANYALATGCTINQPTAAITARPLTLKGATVAEKTYDATDDATITAVTFEGLVPPVMFDGTVVNAGESLELTTDYTITNAKFGNVNAGTGKNVTATVALGTSEAAKNYSLANGSLTTTGTITKAERGIEIAAMTLVGDTLSQKLDVKASNLDNSFAPTYSSNATGVATVGSNGKVTAVKNGTATITVSAAATTNYNAGAATVAVKVVTVPVTAVTVASSEATDKLTATLTGNTIQVFGFVTSGKTITVTPIAYDNVTLSSAMITIVDTALATGGSFTASIDGQTVSYTIDTSKVQVKPATVTIDSTKKQTEVAAGVAAAVSTALNDSATKAEGLEAAAASQIFDKINGTGFDAGSPVTAEVKMNLKATAAGEGTLSLEIKPQITLTGKKDGDDKTLTEDITELPTPIKISIKLPSTFSYNGTDSLFAKHTKADGTIEYLPITVTGAALGYIATWYQDSFSSVEIVKDTRSGTVNYPNSTSVTYTVVDIGKTDLPNGSWTIEGATYTGKVTEALLNAINGKTVSATLYTTPSNPGGGGGGAVATTYTITATAGEGGTITPSGKVSVTQDNDKSFDMKPNTGYVLDKLLVDGKEVTAAATYTFSKVKANHTISATFKKADTTKPIFNDIQNHWAKDSIEKIVALGIMNGVGNEQFAPDLNTSRAMLVTVLYRLEKEPNMTISSFMDVPSDAYYAKAVAWAEQNGIVDGIGGNQFAPNQDITREQLAAILYRYAKYKGMDVSGRADLDGFADRTNVGAWALDAMRWAVSSKLIGGRSATELAPDGKATRAEVATILVRWLEA